MSVHALAGPGPWEPAHWKLVMENNRECFHCAGWHPELMPIISAFGPPAGSRVEPEYRALVARKTADSENSGCRSLITCASATAWCACLWPGNGRRLLPSASRRTNPLGIRSGASRPRPYSALMEVGTRVFIRWCMQQMLQGLSALGHWPRHGAVA